MSTQITLPSTGGGQGLDGTDYIYVYGDGTPAENGVELQDALYQAGIDKVATGRKQTVVVGPGSYYNSLGSAFNFNLNATAIKSLTGDIDVNLDFAANKKIVAIDSNVGGNVTQGIISTYANNIYSAQEDLELNYVNSLGFMSNSYCNSDYIGLDDNSLILFNSGFSSTSGGSGQRFIKVTQNSHTIGPDLNLTFPSFSISRYWIVKNPITGLREVFVSGSYPGSYVFFKINLNTLSVDNSFAPVLVNGYFEDIVIDIAGNIIVAGFFTTINTYPALNIAKIEPTGFLETMQFTNNIGSGFNNTVRTLAYDGINDKLYCGGSFNAYNGNSCPNFTIINATNASFIGSVATPNNTVIALKFWEGDDKLYAFGGFSAWGLLAPGRNAVLDLTGDYVGSLFSTNVSYFNSKIEISGNINDSSTNKILRFKNVAGASLIQSTLIKPDDIIEYNVSTGTITPYASQVLGSPNYAYNINKPNVNLEESFLLEGYLLFENLAILDGASNYGYEPYAEPYHIQGLNIAGAFLTPDGFGTIKINKCFVSSIYNISSYLNYPSFVNGELVIDNSTVQKTACPVNLNLNNSILNSAIKSNEFSESYLNIFLKNSSITSVYNNGPGIYLNSLFLENSKVIFSFNDGFKRDIPNGHLKSNFVDARNSYFENSFNFSQLPRLRLHSCLLQNALNFAYLPGDINGERVLAANTPFYGELVNITGSGYLTQDYSFSLSYDITPYYFYQTFSMTFDNCISTQGESIKFQNIPVRAIFNTRFRDCNVSGSPYDGDSTTALNLTFRPGYGQDLGNPVNNVVFENCRVTKFVNALNIIINLEDTPQTSSILMAMDKVTINNCHHTAQNSILSSMCLRVSSPINITNLVLSKIDIQNSSVNCTFINTAFLSGIDSTNGLSLDKVNFRDCHVTTGNTSSHSFLSFIMVSNSVQLLQTVNFINCSAVNTAGNIDYYPGYPPNYTILPRANAFFAAVATLYIDNFISNTPLVFINCQADRGFVDMVQTIGTIVMYAENCVAHAGGSFGKGIIILRGSIIRCDGGVGSFGDAFFKGSWSANHGAAQFLYCIGINSFGTDKALGNPISSGGKLYHYTTSGGPSNWTDVTWADSNYNV